MDLFAAERFGRRIGGVTDSLLGLDKEFEKLKAKRLNLKETVEKHFDGEENTQDLAIMYEITGY